jgi:hypothetical protein
MGSREHSEAESFDKLTDALGALKTTMTALAVGVFDLDIGHLHARPGNSRLVVARTP